MKANLTESLENSLEAKDARIAELENANQEMAQEFADLENNLRLRLAALESALTRERALRTWRTDHPPIQQLILAVIEYPSRGKSKLERVVCRVDEEDDLWSESGNNIGYYYRPWFTRFVKWMPLPEIGGTDQV